MHPRTPRQSTRPLNPAAARGRSAKRLADAARRIGVSKRVTPYALLSADSATRSLRAAANHPLVRDISDERGMGDGVWIYLHDGWNDPSTDANAIHEDSVSECLALLKGAYFDAATLDEPEADALAAEAAEAAVPTSGENICEPMPTPANVRAILTVGDTVRFKSGIWTRMGNDVAPYDGEGVISSISKYGSVYVKVKLPNGGTFNYCYTLDWTCFEIIKKKQIK